MKVHRVTLDVNEYQSLAPEDESVWATPLLSMDCSPKAGDWRRLGAYVANPNRPAGDFFYLCAGAIVVSPDVVNTVVTYLEMAGELLPVSCDGQEFLLLNVTECPNCLDQERTEWVVGRESGKRIRIQKYAFHPSRFSESTILKIPETCKGEILALEGVKDPEDEFKHVVESKGLKGLLFEEVWSSK